jgi:hypothetical protein
MTNVQGWSTPFHYDNIENNMRTQHRMKWLEYDAIHSNYECNQFFTNVFVVFKNSIKAHFVSKYVGKQKIVFDINKDIIETFVSNMIYKVEDETNNDNENIEENLVFGNEVERIVVLVRHWATITKVKEKMLLLFK